MAFAASAVAAREGIDLRSPLGQAVFDGTDLYWVEGRPGDGGRNVIVRWDAAAGAHDVLPAGFSARSRINEYGGGAFVVAAGTVYFANEPGQRVYRLTPGRAWLGR